LQEVDELKLKNNIFQEIEEEDKENKIVLIKKNDENYEVELLRNTMEDLLEVKLYNESIACQDLNYLIGLRSKNCI